MPHSQRLKAMASNHGKSSLTFESIVCSQLELQRRAASFSHRRSTTCRRSAQYPSSNRLSTSSNRTMLLAPASSQSLSLYPSIRTLASMSSDITTQFPQTRSSNGSKRSQTSSANSTRKESLTDRHSFVSMFYWDTPSRGVTSKKV